MNIRRALGFTATFIALVGSGIGLAGPANAFPGNYHEIVNTATDKCVDVKDGSKADGAIIHQWDCAGDNSQLWAANDLGNGYLQFQNRNSGKCLGLVLGTVTVNLQSCYTANQSQWWRWKTADVFGNLVLQGSPIAGGPCLALRPNSSKNGTTIGIADCATTNAQIWHLE